MASWLRVSGRPADGRERGVTVNAAVRAGAVTARAVRVGARCCGAGTPRPWCGCRRCASSTTGPSGCASGRRRPSRSARAGTPSGAPVPSARAAKTIARTSAQRRVGAVARGLEASPRAQARRRAPARGRDVARDAGRGRPAPPARRPSSWLAQAQRAQRLAQRRSRASRSAGATGAAPKPRARSHAPVGAAASASASAPSPSRSQNVLRNACTKAEPPGRGRAARGLAAGVEAIHGAQIDTNQSRCLRWLGDAAYDDRGAHAHVSPLRLRGALGRASAARAAALRPRPRPAPARAPAHGVLWGGGRARRPRGGGHRPRPQRRRLDRNDARARRRPRPSRPSASGSRACRPPTAAPRAQLAPPAGASDLERLDARDALVRARRGLDHPRRAGPRSPPASSRARSRGPSAARS